LGSARWSETERNETGLNGTERASDAGRRREAPGTRRLRRGFSVDARGCFEVILWLAAVQRGGSLGGFRRVEMMPGWLDGLRLLGDAQGSS
jgi:hypothetical protein